MGGTIGISPKAGTEAKRLKLIAMLHILLKRFTMSVSPRVILYSVLCTITFILHRHTVRSAVPPKAEQLPGKILYADFYL